MDQKQPELEPLPYTESWANMNKLLQLIASEVGTEQQYVGDCMGRVINWPAKA